MSYTMEERTAAQNKAFSLRKGGYRATRILRKVLVDHDKNKKPIYENRLVAFGYSKNRDIPKEVNENHVEKYNFTFIYDNE